jgi:hypothetical protein
MAATAALLLLLAGPIPGMTASRQNAAADAVVELSRALGIDFQARDQAGDPKTKDREPVDETVYDLAGPGAWLFAQVQVETDEISEPPAALQEFLRVRRDSLWSLIAALEKDAPDWGAPADSDFFNGRISATIRLEKVLVATALAEEREGHRIDASRALEASWSLARSIDKPLLIDQLLSVAIQKWQSGALRKMREPALQWLGRLSGDVLWSAMLEAVEAEGKRHPSESAVSDGDPWSELGRIAPGAIATDFGKLSPCQASLLSGDEIWQMVDRDLSRTSSPEVLEVRNIYKSTFLPTVTNAVRRAARLSVDRELTLRILELRLEKEASRDNAWPPKLTDSQSEVCAGASYEYSTAKGGIEIRFDGAVEDSDTGPPLPLTFRTGAKASPSAMPTPSPAPLTPAPSGGMISGQ